MLDESSAFEKYSQELLALLYYELIIRVLNPTQFKLYGLKLPREYKVVHDKAFKQYYSELKDEIKDTLSPLIKYQSVRDFSKAISAEIRHNSVAIDKVFNDNLSARIYESQYAILKLFYDPLLRLVIPSLYSVVVDHDRHNHTQTLYRSSVDKRYSNLNIVNLISSKSGKLYRLLLRNSQDIKVKVYKSITDYDKIDKEYRSLARNPGILSHDLRLFITKLFIKLENEYESPLS